MPFKRHIVLFFFFSSLALTGLTQTRTLSAGFGYGFTSPHHPDMWNYITGHAKQFHAEYFLERDTALNRGGNILKGFGFSFINSGNPDTMGYAIAMYPQFQFPLNRKKQRTYFVLGCGLEINTRTYTEENFVFNAISSHFNALVVVGFRRSFRLTPEWRLQSELLWTHFSNGSTKAPNLGLNIPTIGLGIEYRWKTTNTDKKLQAAQMDLREGSWTFCGTGSWKQVKADARTCPAFSMSAEKKLSGLSTVNSWSIGSDLIVDFTMNDRLTEFSDTIVPFSNNLKLSLKAGWTVPVGKLHIVLQAGSYLKNSNFKKEFAFERLALRYFLNENIGLHIALRAHFAKADAIEYGIVYRFKGNKMAPYQAAN